MPRGIKGSSPKEEEKPVKTSIILPPKVWQQVSFISLMTKKDKSQILVEALTPFIDSYEKENGSIPVK